MSEEWLQVVKRSRFYLVFVTFYGSIVESFFSLIGVVGVVIFVGNLLSFAGLQVLPNELDIHLRRDLMRESGSQFVLSCFALLLAFAFTVALAWWGLRGVCEHLLDAVWPTITYEGCLDEITTFVEGGLYADVRHWKLTSGQKAWAIPVLSTERLFEKEVTAGREIRIRYLRGSEEITRMWVNCTQRLSAAPSASLVAPAHRKKKLTWRDKARGG